jgi:hypothetical protein
MQARHTGLATIKTALEQADILIPFPIRTLDFGAKGGEKLNTMWQKKTNITGDNEGDGESENQTNPNSDTTSDNVSVDK